MNEQVTLFNLDFGELMLKNTYIFKFNSRFYTRKKKFTYTSHSSKKKTTI